MHRCGEIARRTEANGEAAMTDANELDAEIEAVLLDLVEAGLLELATKRGAKALAQPLCFALERNRELDIEKWLLDHVEVSELFLDRDELHVRFTAVRARMAGARPPQRVHPALAAAIAEHLEDADAWAVYGDWLVEQGDPRGELVAIQLAGGTGEHLIARYREHFLGTLDEDPDDERERPALTWRNGFLQSADIIDADLDVLLALESARFLETLVVRAWKDISVMTHHARLPETLRSLTFEQRGPARVDLDVLLGAVPHLTALSVTAEAVRLPAYSTLRELAIATDVLEGPTAAFANDTVLERLALSYDTDESDVVATLCTSPPPALRELDLRDCELTPEEERRIRQRWPSVQLGPRVRYEPIDE